MLRVADLASSLSLGDGPPKRGWFSTTAASLDVRPCTTTGSFWNNSCRSRWSLTESLASKSDQAPAHCGLTEDLSVEGTSLPAETATTCWRPSIPVLPQPTEVSLPSASAVGEVHMQTKQPSGSPASSLRIFAQPQPHVNLNVLPCVQQSTAADCCQNPTTVPDPGSMQTAASQPPKAESMAPGTSPVTHDASPLQNGSQPRDAADDSPCSSSVVSLGGPSIDNTRHDQSSKRDHTDATEDGSQRDQPSKKDCADADGASSHDAGVMPTSDKPGLREEVQQSHGADQPRSHAHDTPPAANPRRGGKRRRDPHGNLGPGAANAVPGKFQLMALAEATARLRQDIEKAGAAP